MAMDFEFEDRREGPAKIKVIGVGGGGGNAINTMVASGRLKRVDFLVANSDAQDLERNDAGAKLKIGPEALGGLGCGADPEKGRLAAEESEADIIGMLHGANMVFVTAGMGGGTGTGAAPVVARIAREMGALTVGVVTQPFWFEGNARCRKAQEGIIQLREAVDSLIVIPNDRLLQLVGQDTAATEAFKKVDEVLLDAVAGISEIIDIGGFINVDFNDVRAIMAQRGRALMGTGRATGERRAEIAAQNAISSPLLDDVRIEGATGILLNVTGSENLGLKEIQDACAPIHASVSGDANIIFGAVVDPTMGDEVKVTVIATGIDKDEDRVRATTGRRRGRDTQAAAATPKAEPRATRGGVPRAMSVPSQAAPAVTTTRSSLPTVTTPTQDEWERPAYVRRREAEQAATQRKSGPPPLGATGGPPPMVGTSAPAAAAPRVAEPTPTASATTAGRNPAGASTTGDFDIAGARRREAWWNKNR